MYRSNVYFLFMGAARALLSTSWTMDLDYYQKLKYFLQKQIFLIESITLFSSLHVRNVSTRLITK